MELKTLVLIPMAVLIKPRKPYRKWKYQSKCTVPDLLPDSKLIPNIRLGKFTKLFGIEILVLYITNSVQMTCGCVTFLSKTIFVIWLKITFTNCNSSIIKY